MDQIVERFDLEHLAKYVFYPLICVYENPKDYPGKYVARLWDRDSPTNLIALTDSLADLRKLMPLGMKIRAREARDSPVIVEVWI